MGWKSTVDITRAEAIKLVFERLSNVHTLSNSELGNLLLELGYGEDNNLPYYGHNFLVSDFKQIDNEYSSDGNGY